MNEFSRRMLRVIGTLFSIKLKGGLIANNVVLASRNANQYTEKAG